MTSFEGANWFIGLPVEAGRWFAELSAPPDKTRLFHPDDLHLTIAFLGPCGEAGAHAAWDAFSWPAPPLRVTLGEVVPLGKPRRPSALSALLVEGRDPVEAAMRASRDAPIAIAGGPKEDRPPKAHVTIARISHAAGGAERARALAWAQSLELHAPAAMLGSVALYASSPGPEGRRYERVRARALT